MNYFIRASISHQNLQRLTLQIFLHEKILPLAGLESKLWTSGPFLLSGLIEMIVLFVHVCVPFSQMLHVSTIEDILRNILSLFCSLPSSKVYWEILFSGDDIFLSLPYIG